MSLQIGKILKNRYWSVRSGLLPSVRNFSFNYDSDWLQSPYAQQIDPDLNGPFLDNNSEAARKSIAFESHSGIACSSRVFGACKTPQFVDQFAVGAAIGGADSHIDTALRAGTFSPCSHSVRHRYSNNPGRVNRIAGGKFRKQGKIAIPREQHFHAMRNADSSDPGIMYYRSAYSWTLNETL